eukprot:m.329386 g.329386  ORF g.329386 m.329386 type:complete len:63 (-) comp16036_c0_seq29:279-467(-)
MLTFGSAGAAGAGLLHTRSLRTPSCSLHLDLHRHAIMIASTAAALSANLTPTNLTVTLQCAG